jgi:hypothetical protein
VKQDTELKMKTQANHPASGKKYLKSTEAPAWCEWILSGEYRELLCPEKIMHPIVDRWMIDGVHIHTASIVEKNTPKALA